MRKLLTTVAVAAALAGCAAPPNLLRSTDLRLPLDDYLLSPAELRELSAARELLVRRCLAAAGFAYPSRADSAPKGPRTWNERRYGGTDADLVAVDGYGLGDREPTGDKPAPKLDAAARAALEGPRGCAAKAGEEQRRGGPELDRDLPRRLASESFARSRGAPEVTDVVRKWSDCMRAGGFAYDDPLAPPADPRWAGPGKPAAAEIATATADLECKRRTNLVGVWFTAETAVQRGLVDGNRAALESIRRAADAELALSRRLLTP
ncbi:hypothetical protein [Amycolatopsis solani]|uniref:hypothetical protein n=1 Tax=Amycolatopsis solani TaxID=3028615 RepID=UPI0025B0BAB6|nr:hypothetical protein [Amycolatopsis sp. MEP2-6]